MFNKKLMVVVVLVAVAFSVPSWGAQFRKVKDQQFVEMCKEGNTQGVIEAIKSGASVNAKNNDGETALMWAVHNRHTEIVNALIEAGADVNAKTNNGGTALMVAAIWCNAEAIKILINAGGDVNAKINDGRTALMLAAEVGDTENVNALIEAGADDLTDNEGKTALIHAAASKRSNPETVNALIEAGSYVKQKDNNGWTVLDYARNNPKFKGTDALKRLEELSR